MIPFLVLRHGKTDWNLQKKMQGRTDIPLCPLGREELGRKSLPPQFTEFKWVTSPLMRARETAEILGGSDAEIVSELIEMNFGDWEGHKLQDLRAEDPGAMRENEARGLLMRPPGGETPAEVQERLKSYFKKLVFPTVAVTHKGVIRALKSLAYNWDMTDKLPVEFNWGAAHLFMIDQNGMPHPEKMNIELEDKAS